MLKSMYALKNRVQLIGNVGQKPEIKITAKGLKTARFVLAINESYKNSRGERVKDTQWHFLMVSGKLADVVEKLLDKGTEIAIDGRLVNRSFTDKEGIKRTATEVMVNEILLLGNKEYNTMEEPVACYGKQPVVVEDLPLAFYTSIFSMKPCLGEYFN